MPMYDYKCSCGHIIEDRYYSNHLEAPDEILCIKCKKRMAKKLFPKLTIQVKEENKLGNSTKPSSYWRNAERNRLENIKKQHKIMKEKIYYKDREMMERKEQIERRKQKR
jgi:predicted nucleic acid-binding Zn ribbon protein